MVARIEALEKATVDDMAAIHADRVCIPARELVGLLGRLRVSAAADPHGDDEDWRAALTRLAVGRRDGQGPGGAGDLRALRERLLRDLMTPILGPLAPEAFAAVQGGGVAHMVRIQAQLAEMISKDNRSLLPAGAEWPAVLASALAGAVSDLRAALGDDMDGLALGAPAHHASRAPARPRASRSWRRRSTRPPSRSAATARRSMPRGSCRAPAITSSRPWRATSSTSPTGSRAAGSCPTAPPAIPAARTGPTSSRPGPIAASCPCATTGLGIARDAESRQTLEPAG